MQKIIISRDVCKCIEEAAVWDSYDKVFVLTDENTNSMCLTPVMKSATIRQAKTITIKATDANKTLESLSHVWKELSDNGCTRHSCLINIGGGMVTDLGGFAASTFKRGIDFVNIPTTLLAMVDASAGGKTGINFNGLKNEIGVFNEAKSVIIDTVFLKTLTHENLLSGYAEMLKHSILKGYDMWKEHICFNLEDPNFNTLLSMIEESVSVKQHIVDIDPHEKGIRKALNLGHTVGHAIESMSIKRGKPLLHGFAVAYGIICELYISCAIAGFPIKLMRQTARFIYDNYGHWDFTCNDYEILYSLMLHDKKNIGDNINFTLMADIGNTEINKTASKELIFEALDFFREN